MKKLVLIALTLLALTLIPSSLISPQVFAQVATNSIPCLYADMHYSEGAFLRVDLNENEYVMLQCALSNDKPRWESRNMSTVTVFTVPPSE